MFLTFEIDFARDAIGSNHKFVNFSDLDIEEQFVI